MTGVRTAWTTVLLTEPSSMAGNPPRPRLPTTTSWADPEGFGSLVEIEPAFKYLELDPVAKSLVDADVSRRAGGDPDP